MTLPQEKTLTLGQAVSPVAGTRWAPHEHPNRRCPGSCIALTARLPAYCDLRVIPPSTGHTGTTPAYLPGMHRCTEGLYLFNQDYINIIMLIY